MIRVERALMIGLLTGGLLSGSDQDRVEHTPGGARFISFDAPGAMGTFALDINNGGLIVGRYRDQGGATHGFLRRRSGAIVTIDFPGSIFTVAAGINNRGDIVGQYSRPEDPELRHGYLLHEGQFTTLDPRGSVFTNALGVNGRGDITGRFQTEDEALHGFRLRGGAFKTFDFPGAAQTHMHRSNNAGTIVGAFVDADDHPHLFVARHGNFETLPIPASKSVAREQADINAYGDVVGAYCNGEPPCTATHGFLWIDQDERFERIDVPDAISTATFGMNDARDIVGGYLDENGVNHGFLMSR